MPNFITRSKKRGWDEFLKCKWTDFTSRLGFFFLFRPEIDDDGVIEPDTDEPQEMGDFEIVEVSFFWAFCLRKITGLIVRLCKLFLLLFPRSQRRWWTRPMRKRWMQLMRSGKVCPLWAKTWKRKRACGFYFDLVIVWFKFQEKVFYPSFVVHF